MNFSAAELVKKSAAQLVYIELKRLSFKPTIGQLKGDKYANEIVKKNEASSEKRGIVSLNKEDTLFFCIDLVKDNKFVEIKMVEDENTYEDWYLESSIIQSTLYASLLTKVKILDTPKFRKKEGYKQEIVEVPNNFEFELWFGISKYKVYPNEDILNHYLKKAELIKDCIKLIDYDSAKLFDSSFKFKEFDIFQPLYDKINRK